MQAIHAHPPLFYLGSHKQGRGDSPAMAIFDRPQMGYGFMGMLGKSASFRCGSNNLARATQRKTLRLLATLQI